MVNTHWGGVTENNHFGTHEFMDLCDQLGCEPYICGNLGSGSVREMQQWVEYLAAPAGPMADLRRRHGRAEPWTIRMWGVGNENWGCGGNMRPEYYADEYKRYATYCRSFGDSRLYKVACGACGADYRWTEVLMREAGRAMQGLALHYYCGSGHQSRSATQFEEEDWFWQLKNALAMEELVGRHAAIMDQHDPERRVGMLVDEWGAWHAVEPGTNPGFLYQQNSLRDALVAAVTLDIFNRHCDRVHGANIAQTVNVLQAMVLTEEQGDRILLTPTYHVFAMYRPHHEALLLPAHLKAGEYAHGDQALPVLSATASRDESGKIHLTVANLHPEQDQELSCQLRGATVRRASGEVLTADAIAAHNTFDEPDRVKPAPFKGCRVDGDRLAFTLPARSVVALELS
jgi:alpha-N-arabinofuranosidase